MNEQNDSHWWEFYGVRYAQGTVVGAMIVFFLFSQNEALKKLLFLPADPKDFGMPHLILLAVYGLAYCYIASAPILIMHAGRGCYSKVEQIQILIADVCSECCWCLHLHS